MKLSRSRQSASLRANIRRPLLLLTPQNVLVCCPLNTVNWIAPEIWNSSPHFCLTSIQFVAVYARQTTFWLKSTATFCRLRLRRQCGPAITRWIRKWLGCKWKNNDESIAKQACTHLTSMLSKSKTTFTDVVMHACIKRWAFKPCSVVATSGDWWCNVIPDSI